MQFHQLNHIARTDEWVKNHLLMLPVTKEYYFGKPSHFQKILLLKHIDLANKFIKSNYIYLHKNHLVYKHTNEPLQPNTLYALATCTAFSTYHSQPHPLFSLFNNSAPLVRQFRLIFAVFKKPI